MESIDWSNLSFGYMPTDYNVRCIYKDGKWGTLQLPAHKHSKYTWQPLAFITDKRHSKE